MGAHFSSSEVDRILQVLSSLPGGKTLAVQTKRYPRLLPAESGAGYEERQWRFAPGEFARDLPLPADAEDIIITWKGVAQASAGQPPTSDVVIAALAGIADGGIWDHDVCTHRAMPEAATDGAELEVRVYRRY